MNIQKFTGSTAREALGKARLAFGDGTLILSNRQTAEGVVVMATAEEALSDLDARALAAKVQHAAARLPATKPPAASAPAATPLATPAAATQAAPAAMPPAPHPDQRVEDDTAQLAMSTLSFQDYVRERMLRKRMTENPARADETDTRHMMAGATTLSPTVRTAAAVSGMPRPAPKPASRPAPPSPRDPSAAIATRGVVEELQAMHDMIEDRFNTFAWLGQARQHPIQSNLMLKLMRAGYSPVLARAILEHMPESPAAEALQWMMDAIERNLRTCETPLHEEGGVYALIGATGVGKTTTVAKLAGQCARAHGAASVGMITLDTNRVGAHAQLREHGRNLGLVAHLAHDRAALQDLLGLFMNKKLVLIDTTGIAPRDPGRDESLAVLDLPGVRRLLVLGAGTHGDTLDDAVAAFRAPEAKEPMQIVLSKIDEAVKLGPALDVAIRHQLRLRGVTNGQNVPRDLAPADAGELVRSSMRANGKASPFDPKAAELGFFFMPPAPRTARTPGAVAAHA